MEIVEIDVLDGKAKIFVAAENGIDATRLRKFVRDAGEAFDRLHDIGDYAHEHSTGPAVPDALWTVREMAYELV